MNQPQNPLDQLRDIHLPETLDSWQVAPGWWILIALLTGLLIYTIFRWSKRRQSFALLSPALTELETIRQLPARGESVAQLSALIKRICLLHFPKAQVASLSGNSWITFLNNQFQEELFNEQMTDCFTESAYRQQQALNPDLWESMIDKTSQLVEHIIKQQHREPKA